MNRDGSVNGRGSAAPFRIGDWTIDPALDEISRDGNTVKLEPRMMRLLCRLAENPGEVVSSQALLDDVWSGVVVGSSSVYQAVSALRRILGDDERSSAYVATVARKGYRLIANVERGGVAGAASVSSSQSVADHEGTHRNHRIAAYALTALAIMTIVGVALWRQEPTANSSSALDAASATPGVAPSRSLPARPANLPSVAVCPLRAGSSDEANELFAASMTEILKIRLATQKQLILASFASTPRARAPDDVATSSGTPRAVRLAVKGRTVRTARELRVDVTISDDRSDDEIWTHSYSRTPGQLAALREDIVRDVGAAVHVQVNRVDHPAIDPDAYALYLRGFRRYLQFNREGYTAAEATFRRTTMLYPDFARGYFGLAIVLRQETYISDSEAAKRQEIMLRKALDRAIELDPEFGEAIVERAESTDDVVESERLFRLGLDKMPSYSIGAWKYGVFLSRQGRSAEGLAAYDYGLRIDPDSTLLLDAKAEVLGFVRGDIEGFEATLRRILEIDPNDRNATASLAWSRYSWRGKTAEALGLFERQLMRDPDDAGSRYLAAAAYLDVDDVAAARSVAKDNGLALTLIAQYEHAPVPPQSLNDGVRDWLWDGWSLDSVCPQADAIRDRAMATGDYAGALSEFAKLHPQGEGPSSVTSVFDLANAHVLMLAGETDRGRKLVGAVLRIYDTEEVGRPEHWFARNRATAYALLGDDQRALTELEASVKRHDLRQWWYTAEVDPVFAHLRGNARFQALAVEAKGHRADQRAQVDEMRRKGELLRRP